jgi:hypothetical protein
MFILQVWGAILLYLIVGVFVLKLYVFSFFKVLKHMIPDTDQDNLFLFWPISLPFFIFMCLPMLVFKYAKNGFK